MSFPEDRMFDLMNISQDFSPEVTVLMTTRYFVKCKDYHTLVAHVLNTIALAIIEGEKVKGKLLDVFDLRIDMLGTKFKNVDIGFMKSLLKSIVKMFPGKLRKCEIYNAPGFFPPLYKMLSPIIPKEARGKIHFIKK